MTPEEAGEEILAGRPYETCNLCQGAGVRKMATGSGRLVDIKCTVCFRKGNVPRPLYHVAAKTLGLSIPPQPQGSVEKHIEVTFDWKLVF